MSHLPDSYDEIMDRLDNREELDNGREAILLALRLICVAFLESPESNESGASLVSGILLFWGLFYAAQSELDPSIDNTPAAMQKGQDILNSLQGMLARHRLDLSAKG